MQWRATPVVCARLNGMVQLMGVIYFEVNSVLPWRHKPDARGRISEGESNRFQAQNNRVNNNEMRWFGEEDNALHLN